MLSEALIQQTEGRYRARQAPRTRTIDALRGSIFAANDKQRVAQRRERILASPTLPQPSAIELSAAGAPLDTLERVINQSDLLNVNYLELALRAARAVARVQVRNASGTPTGWGSGFFVAPGVLLTNNHVLPDADTAAASRLQMPGEDDIDGNPRPVEVFALDPQRFFVSSPAGDLDYTLVAVTDSTGTLSSYGFTRLIAAQGKLLKGEYVTIVQFPGGGQKQIALRQNQVVDILPNFLHYETDTAPGSSGAPVFNDQWEVVALHHSGVPERRDGAIINRLGQPWTADQGEEMVHWIANEGVRASLIVADLTARTLTAAAAAVRKLIVGDA